MENIYLRDWFEFIYILLGGLIAQQILARLIFPLLRGKDRNSARAILLDALIWPFNFFIIITALYIGFHYTPLHLSAQAILTRLYRSALIFVFFKVLYNLSSDQEGRLNQLFERLNYKLDLILSNIISDIFRVLIVVLGFLTIIREWEYDVSGLVAGLGLGGLALAMASKDSLANIFGGFVILADKPFSIGDWIRTNEVEGAVEKVSFRSTRIRTAEQALVHIPNSNLTNVAIVNFSRRGKRRAGFTIGLTYTAQKQQVHAFTELLKEALSNNPALSQEPGDILVTFSDYGERSFNINIVFFTLATDFRGHNTAKETVNFAIMDIVEKTGVSMSVPSRSVYFETPLEVKNKT